MVQPFNQTLSGGEPGIGNLVEGPDAKRLEATQPSKQQLQSGGAEQQLASHAPQAPSAATSTAAGAHAEASSGHGWAANAAEQQAASPETESAAVAASSTPAEAITGGTQAARAPAPDVSALEQQVQQQAAEIARLQQKVALLPGLQQQVQLLTTAVLAQQQLQQERQGWQQASKSLQCQMEELLQIAREGQQRRMVPRPAGAGGRR